MNIATQWSSERLNQCIDLTKLSREELILELLAERGQFVELEQLLREQK